MAATKRSTETRITRRPKPRAASPPAQRAGLVERTREKARTAVTARLDAEKFRATQELGSMVEATREITERLRSNGSAVAPYIDRVTDRIERFAADLNGKDVEELLAEAQRFARRRPAIAVGISFALGLAVARFLKSSSFHRSQAAPSWAAASGI